MGCFDTYIIPCPHCGEMVEDQKKPGYMNMYRFGEDARNDIDFIGNYTCSGCDKNFRVEFESVPKVVIKKYEDV